MSHTVIIAEAGVNHNGNFELAKKLVEVAKEAGADYVKFQTGKPELVISRFAAMADYQKKNVGKIESQLDMVRKILLPFGDFPLLADYCSEVGIKFLSTPFDLLSIDLLNTLNMDFWKIPSGEITNYPYLKKIAKTKKTVIMSTGMCEMDEIQMAIDVLTSNGLNNTQIQLLHCNTEYPTPMTDVNLSAMEEMRQRFDLPVGYSDHTQGIEVSIAAVAMGAKIIEKHFTLDKKMEGPDHKASLEPAELKDMITSIRNIEQAIGTGHKTVSMSESKNKMIARKSIVAARTIKKGDVFTEENLAVKRPGYGVSPMRWEEVIGKKAVRDFEEDELIEI